MSWKKIRNVKPIPPDLEHEEVSLLWSICFADEMQLVMINEDQSESIDIERLRSHFHDEGRLLLSDAVLILRKVRKIVRGEPNVLYLRDPMVGACSRSLLNSFFPFLLPCLLLLHLA